MDPGSKTKEMADKHQDNKSYQAKDVEDSSNRPPVPDTAITSMIPVTTMISNDANGPPISKEPFVRDLSSAEFKSIPLSEPQPSSSTSTPASNEDELIVKLMSLIKSEKLDTDKILLSLSTRLAQQDSKSTTPIQTSGSPASTYFNKASNVHEFVKSIPSTLSSVPIDVVAIGYSTTPDALYTDSGNMIRIRDTFLPVLVFMKNKAMITASPDPTVLMSGIGSQAIVEAICKPSIETFSSGGNIITLELNPELIPSSVTVKGGLPVLPIQQPVETTVSSYISSKASVLSGIIATALNVSIAGAYIFLPKKESQLSLAALSPDMYPPLAFLLQTSSRKFTNPVGIHPILTHGFSSNELLNADTRAMVTNGNYKLGKGVILDSINGETLIEVEFMNVDTTSAFLVNHYHSQISSERLDADDVRDIVLAHSPPSTTVYAHSQQVKLSMPLILNPPSEALCRLMFSLIMYPTLSLNILDMYADVLYKSGIISINRDANPDFGVQQTTSSTTLINVLNEYSLRPTDQSVARSFAMECAPDMFPVNIQFPPISDSSSSNVVGLLMVIMFCVLHPKKAFLAGYQVANYLHDILSRLCESSLLAMKNEVGWTTDPSRTKLSASEYRSGVRPLILMGAGRVGTNPLMIRLAGFLSPVGYLANHSDTAVQRFPRLRSAPTTYIPYPKNGSNNNEDNALFRHLRTAVNFINEKLRDKIIINTFYIREKTQLSAIREWLHATSNPMRRMCQGLCALGKVMAMTRNYYCTFKTDFVGRLGDDLYDNFAVIDAEEDDDYVGFKAQSDPDTNMLTVDPRVVFTTMYVSDWFGRKDGRPLSTDNDSHVMPMMQPIEMLNLNLALSRTSDILCMAFGVVNALAKNINTPGLTRLRALLTNHVTTLNDPPERNIKPLITKQNYASYVKAVISILGENGFDQIGKVYNSINRTMYGEIRFFNPRITLISPAFELRRFADLPESISNPIVLMDPSDEERYIMCLDLLAAKRSPINKLNTGVILSKELVTVYDYNALPSVANYVEVDFEDLRFGSMMVGNVNRLTLLYNGRVIVEPVDTPLLMIKVVKPVHSSDQVAFLVNAYLRQRIKIKIPNIVYTASIDVVELHVAQLAESKFTPFEMLTNGMTSIPNVSFYDTRSIDTMLHAPPVSMEMYRNVFPLDNTLTKNVIASGIVHNTSQERGYKPIPVDISDSGMYNNGALFSNRIPKTYWNINYTNPVVVYTRKSNINSTLTVGCALPDVLEDPSEAAIVGQV